MRHSLDAPQRPSQPPQRDDLLFLFFAQDIAHVTERNLSANSMSRFSYLVGRFSGVHLWPVLGVPRGFVLVEALDGAGALVGISSAIKRCAELPPLAGSLSASFGVAL